jgi:hypothetical protein
MIIPSFINQSKINSQTKLKSINYIEGQHFSNKSNNIILDELSRRNIQIIINNPNAINHDRINKDKYINNEQYKQKYLKYKQKYLKMRNQLT